MLKQWRRNGMRSVIGDIAARISHGEPEQGAQNAEAWIPRADISDEEDEVVIDVELPGIKREDIRAEIKNGVLVISGDRKPERKARVSESTRIERHYGHFERTFAFPGTVDEDRITATYEGGVLTIRLPKAKRAVHREMETVAGK